MSAVLVTGGAGYIGSHAVQALVESGQDVIIYDNLSAGHREAARRAGGGKAVLVEGDILDTDHVRRTIEAHGADSVMHFAAWLSVAESVRNPASYYRNNVGGALSVLDAMIATGVRHFVFSSTAAVFGNPEQTPITEDHPTRPINAYGETKLAVERALPHYERAYGIRSVALRYFNAAGADPGGALGEHHDPELHVIPKAIDAAAGTRHVPGLRRGLRHARRHLSARLRARRRPGVGAPPLARRASPRSLVHRLQPRQRPSDFGPGDPAVDRTDRRQAGALHARSAPRRRSRRALRLERPHPHASSAGRRSTKTSTRSCETAWRWREKHPQGYQKEAQG